LTMWMMFMLKNDFSCIYLIKKGSRVGSLFFIKTEFN
jgi:hypothetical protein